MFWELDPNIFYLVYYKLVILSFFVFSAFLKETYIFINKG